MIPVTRSISCHNRNCSNFVDVALILGEPHRSDVLCVCVCVCFDPFVLFSDIQVSHIFGLCGPIVNLTTLVKPF